MADLSPAWPRFGAALRQWRESRRMGLRETASVIHIDHSLLSKWETGQRPVPAEHAARLDAALGAEGLITALHAAITESDELRSTLLEKQLTSSGEDTMERRAAMQILTAIGAGAAIPANALEDVFAAIERATGDRLDLDDWERRLYEYSHLITRRPVGFLINDLTADVLALGRILERGQSPSAQAGLLRVGAGLSGLLATEFGDTGDRRAARLAWRSARRAADASGDREMSVWVRAKEASDTRHADVPFHVVAELADQAVQIADGVPSYGHMRAHSVRAWIAAERGDHAMARAELQAFVQTFEKLPDRSGPNIDPAAFGLAEAYVLWQIAHVHTRTGHERAAESIDQALAIYPRDAQGPRLLLHLIRSADLVRHREIDEGIGHALETLQRMPVTTPRARHMAAEVFAALPDKARGLPAARELRKLTA
ncbi:hypothetical protein Ssi03_52380 [Sphaerisporangium siamense]|uniref:Transcriptional regulator with XRE-family HTH domain n=1 Tax=Sphaerisporangium siamense TaxID=795645 RepID=A0A7W7D861_9ACTN|nr:helix-turn-helix transcriptional regulator [Sphaerisporangium siamense]MBB4702060.1 transcriptional regulator with XRE-family HTH domain [Sphaerisporangium siamense]GII87248.1 hypothetical protein Ssi03_52380 [Sphaerisporangium siamense]